MLLLALSPPAGCCMFLLMHIFQRLCKLQKLVIRLIVAGKQKLGSASPGDPAQGPTCISGKLSKTSDRAEMVSLHAVASSGRTPVSDSKASTCTRDSCRPATAVRKIA